MRTRGWSVYLIAFCSALAACLLLARVAAAQGQLPDYDNLAPKDVNAGADTHLFRPALDSKGFFSVNGADIIGANSVSFGLILDYGNTIMRTRDATLPRTERTVTITDEFGDPMEVMDIVDCTPDLCVPDGPEVAGQTIGTGSDALVPHSFQGTFGFNYGIANRAVVGLQIPVILMIGDPVIDVGPTGQTYNVAALDSQKLSSIALHGKYRILRVEKGIGLAAAIQIGGPIAGAQEDLGADPGFWYWPQIILEKRFGATGRFRMGVNVGFRGHTGPNAEFGESAYNPGEYQLEEGNFEYSNLATYQFGLAWRAIDALDLVAESYGTYQTGGNSDSGQRFSNEIVGGIKLFVERNSYFMLGAGSRFFSTGFEAADIRGLLGFVFEPSIGDRDGDGYKDDEDECPDEPEDFDNFKDEDGCPDPDNDNDGILDVDDRCPNTPEDFDGDEDDDGCPEGDDGDRDGDGILDSKDKCPDEPEDRDGFQDTDGCPDPDNDKDGILDVDDACPDTPEDKDGFEDEDGCPEPDNDRDQILDKDDQCPNDPETYNGFEDEDGCPDKGKVVIEGSDILILEKVNFATASAEILPESFPILEAVATTLNHHPEFLVVEIAGHADERSNDDYNLRLTQQRARSVVQALVKRGVERSRLVSQGYGEYCPQDPGHNPKAWDKNRRVEFKVVKTEDGSTGVERGCQAARAKGVVPPRVP